MKKEHFKKILFALLLIIYRLSFVTFVQAEVLDKIVAIVNSEIILQSELNAALKAARAADPGASDDTVLNDMIDRMLLLEQAKRLRQGSSDGKKDDDALVKEYIERRIRAFIHVPIEESESYYNINRQEFGDNEFYEVKDEIEGFLVQMALEKKLVGHVEDLRMTAYIRIQLGN